MICNGGFDGEPVVFRDIRIFYRIKKSIAQLNFEFLKRFNRKRNYNYEK